MLACVFLRIGVEMNLATKITKSSKDTLGGAIQSARDYLECGGTMPLSPGDSAVGKADDDPEGRQLLAGGFAKRYPRIRLNRGVDPGGITAWK